MVDILVQKKKNNLSVLWAWSDPLWPLGVSSPNLVVRRDY